MVERRVQQLQDEAQQAQNVERRALRERESLTVHLARHRRLRQAGQELEEARLIVSFLDAGDDSLTSPVRRPANTTQQAIPNNGESSFTPSVQPNKQLSVQLPLLRSEPAIAITEDRQPTPQLRMDDNTSLNENVKQMQPTTCLDGVSSNLPPHGVATGHSVGGHAPAYSSTNTAPFQASNFHPNMLPCHQAPHLPSLVTAHGHPPDPSEMPATPNLMDLLIASSYGVPKPSIPYFQSGRESDFALLKLALDSLMSNHTYLSEEYKYQVLLSHLKLPSAYKLAKAYMHDAKPYTGSLRALQDKYGQPRKLVQSEIGAILNMTPVKTGDAEAFEDFALAVHSLVGMLQSLEGEHGFELRCGSHVDRLISKLAPTYRDGFVEHCINKGLLNADSNQTDTLHHLADWLQAKSRAKRIANQAAVLYKCEGQRSERK